MPKICSTAPQPQRLSPGEDGSNRRDGDFSVFSARATLSGCDESPSNRVNGLARTRRNLRLYGLVALLFTALMLVACNDDAPAADVPVADALASEPSANAPSRIPAEIARLSLVDGQTVLRDFRLDAAHGVAYVTDSAYALHVVELDPLQKVATFATTGDLLQLRFSRTAVEAGYLAAYQRVLAIQPSSLPQ